MFVIAAAAWKLILGVKIQNEVSRFWVSQTGRTRSQGEETPLDFPGRNFCGTPGGWNFGIQAVVVAGVPPAPPGRCGAILSDNRALATDLEPVYVRLGIS